MKKLFTQGRLAVLIIVLVLVIDQIIKIAVKTSMFYHESIRITDWFYIYFTENNGMAFGMTLVNKMVLSLFRIVAIGVLGWYLFRQIRHGARTVYVACLTLVFAGAIGNVIDSIFYGAIFSESTYSGVATFVSAGEGYADWLYGRVVDMFYFPLFEFDWPAWMPVVGGNHFIFFAPVFNLADAAISCGTIALLIFYSKTFGESFSLFGKNNTSK